MSGNPNAIDHEFTNAVVCPWCGYHHADLTDFYPENGMSGSETECHECGKPFAYEMYVEVTWTTKRVEVKAELKDESRPAALTPGRTVPG